jgi:hypothetical protein
LGCISDLAAGAFGHDPVQEAGEDAEELVLSRW